jgi:hypothetical protein
VISRAPPKSTHLSPASVPAQYPTLTTGQASLAQAAALEAAGNGNEEPIPARIRGNGHEGTPVGLRPPPRLLVALPVVVFLALLALSPLLYTPEFRCVCGGR